MVTRRTYLKVLVYGRRFLRQGWLNNSGEWHWLEERPVKIAALNKILWLESVPSLSFFVMLSLSSVISTLGLLAGSTATVIGAMIIAPLMGPIIGMAYSLAIANRRLLKRAVMTLLWGTLATVVSALIITWLTQVKTINDEILLRAEPTFLDLGVGLAAGAAGAFTKSRKRVADAVPGVAIAVALVPPLSTIGIGLALGMTNIWSGAMLLFVTNLTAIIFSGIVIFLWQSYGTLERAQRGLTLSSIGLIVLGIPLGFSLRNFLIQSNTRQQISELIETQSLILSAAELQNLKVVSQSDYLRIELVISATPDSIKAEQIYALRDFLAETLNQPVMLSVRVVPIRQFEALPDSKLPKLE